MFFIRSPVKESQYRDEKMLALKLEYLFILLTIYKDCLIYLEGLTTWGRSYFPRTHLIFTPGQS